MLNEIIVLIPPIFHPRDSKITREMELEVDLGITGDDAYEFIQNFACKFEVDVASFDFNDYFLSEGEGFFQPLTSWIFGKKIQKGSRKRLTIGDLEKAVERKKLL